MAASIEFLQLNLQKAKQAQIELGQKIRSYNNKSKKFICLVQEPQLYGGRMAGQPKNCKRYSFPTNPRAAIYTDMSTQGWFIEALSTRDITVFQTMINNKSTLLVSAYLDITLLHVIPPALHKVLLYAEQKGFGIILGMDSNAHSTSFGPDTNKRGENLDLFIAQYKLDIANCSHDPTFESRGAKTCIDITLSSRLAVSLQDWHVDRSYNGSDHNSIYFTSCVDIISTNPSWLWNQANWPAFSDHIDRHLRTHIPSNITQKSLDHAVNDMYEVINTALSIAVPKSRGRIIDTNNPWWSSTLQTKRKQVLKLYKKSRNHPTAFNIASYKETKKEYTRLCQQAKRNSWNDYKENIDSTHGINAFRKILEARPAVRMGTFEKPDGSLTDPGTDTLQHLLDTHCPTATPIQPTQYNKYKSIPKARVTAWTPSWLTTDKLLLAIKQFQNKKSPGPDGLRPIALKHLPSKCIKLILTLYKASILLAFTPTAWKGCRVIFIPKPGKDNYKLAKAWRPISLTNYILKALERLCGWHMDDALKNSPIHIQQHGFRTDRNTDTAISTVTDYIEKHIYNQKHVIGVFLDIQAAFDSIKPSKIKEALLLHGGDPLMVEWYYSYITHRNMFVDINGQQISCTTSLGFPQGGVCSAKFWIIAFNAAISILNEHGVLGLGFADDCVALIGGTNLHQMMSRIQKVVTKLEEWGLTCGLTFNPSKTEVLIFTKSTLKASQYPNKLIVGDHPVPFTQSARYLGVTLDSKLTWNLHFSKQITKCKKYLHMLQKGVKRHGVLSLRISSGFMLQLSAPNLLMPPSPGVI